MADTLRILAFLLIGAPAALWAWKRSGRKFQRKREQRAGEQQAAMKRILGN